MTPGSTGERQPWLARLLSSGFGILVAWLTVLWAIEILDSFVLDDALQSNGIHPRSVDGLDGILWAPFLHSTFGHLISNSIPLLALGFLVSLRGIRYWLIVTAVALIGGGALTWLVGATGNHIGVSGVVFGYFGALMGAAFYDRRLRAIAPAVVALILYSSLIVGIVPQEGISWEGHLFGLVFGVLAARSLVRRQPAPVATSTPAQSWELDEPWLEP